MKLRFKLNVERVDEHLSSFIESIQELLETNKLFMFKFMGNRLFVNTTNGTYNDAYINVKNVRTKRVISTVTAINFAITLQRNCTLSLENADTLLFDIFAYAPEKIDTINLFVDSLKVDILDHIK